MYNGLSFTYEENKGGRRERAWAKLQEISDDICREHNLSVIAEPEKGQSVSHFEHDMQLHGKSWKDKLRAKIAEVAFYSKDFSDFLQRCTECGIEYVYKPQNKVKLKFCLKDEGQQRFTRADTLGDDYTAERIAEQIEQIQKARGVMERLAEKKNTEKPAPAITTKTELKPTVTAPTKPTEIIAPETEVDPWAGIRDIRGADTMIADLESGGITSLDDLRSFFWNTHHDDDHTDELAELNKKIKPIDKLIKMMKQRSQHSAIYKQYQERSAFMQSHFRKKNVAAIDAYEEADKYITEHIKTYYIKGKPPKQSDLQAKSDKLKVKYNALVPEQKAFLIRKQAAS
jgi:relaxase/mobilization nuclease family protein